MAASRGCWLNKSRRSIAVDSATAWVISASKRCAALTRPCGLCWTYSAQVGATSFSGPDPARPFRTPTTSARMGSPAVVPWEWLTQPFTRLYTSFMLRVSDETRERILRIGREEFGGASADETIRRLIDEHWRATAVAAVRRYREGDPEGWANSIAETEEWEGVEAPLADEQAQ